MSESGGQNAGVVAEQLRTWNANAVSEVLEFHGETTIVVPRELLRVTAEHCRVHLQFNFLSDATSVDRFPVEPRFELNYHLVSIPNKSKIRFRKGVSAADPVVDSFVPVWPVEGCRERKFLDLMGIGLLDNPDLRRILFPD